jgi:hypothetical protein
MIYDYTVRKSKLLRRPQFHPLQKKLHIEMYLFQIRALHHCKHKKVYRKYRFPCEWYIGKWNYSSTYILIGQYMELNCQIHAPASALQGEKNPTSFNRRLGWPQSRSGHWAEWNPGPSIPSLVTIPTPQQPYWRRELIHPKQ